MTRLLLLDLLFNYIVLHFFSEVKEIFPDIVSFIFDVIRKFIQGVYDNGFNIRELMEVNLILLKLFDAVNNNDFSFRVVGLIETCISIIGWINSTHHSIVQDSSNKRDDPFRGIVSNNVDTFPLIDSNNVHSFGKSVSIIHVVFPSPSDDFALPLHE